MSRFRPMDRLCHKWGGKNGGVTTSLSAEAFMMNTVNHPSRAHQCYGEAYWQETESLDSPDRQECHVQSWLFKSSKLIQMISGW